MSVSSKPGFSKQFAQWTVQRRFAILALSFLVVLTALYGGQWIQMNDDYRYFFKEGNPQLTAFDELQNTYNKNDNILFVIAPKSGKVFDKETLTAIEALTKEAWQIPFTTRVDSVTNFQHTEAEEDDLIVADLVEDAGSKSEAALRQAEAVALAEPLILHRLIPEDGAVTGINVTLELPGKQMGEQIPAVAHAREIQSRFEAKYPNVEIYLTGFVMLNNAFQEASMHDMKTLAPLMYLFIIVMLVILLRSVSATFAALSIVGASVMATMGVTGWLGIPLSPPSAVAPTLVMTLAVADSVHILVNFLQLMRSGSTKGQAMVEALRQNLKPVFLTSLTTVIGFLSLNFASTQPLNDLGNITAIGVAFAFVFSVTLLPALMMILPVRIKKVEDSGNNMGALANLVIRRKVSILIGSVAAILFLTFMITKNELNDEFVSYFSEALPFRTDTDFASENLTGIYQIEFSLPAGESGGISEPAYLAKLDAFAAWYRTQEGVIHVDTLSDTMKRLNKNMHGDDQAWYRLPEERDLAAQYLLLYEMSLPYGLDLNNRINVDKSATRFVVTIDNVTTYQFRAISEAGEAWLRENAPEHMHVNGAGPPVMFAYLSYANSVSMFQGTALAFLLITLVLIVALRSIKYGLLSLIPNVAPSAMAFGIWGMTDGQINFGLTTVSALSIGIVVDDTIHFLSKYLRARRELGLDAEAAIRYAFNTVGRALVVTTVVLVSGFLIMILSNFDMNESMGKLTALSLVLALITDFFMLPALLLVLGGERETATSGTVAPSPAGPLVPAPVPVYARAERNSRQG